MPISEEHYEILEKRKKLIEQELSASANEWSGIYQVGEHHPTVFMWSPNQGFLTWGSHHTFFPSRINFGKAEFSNNRLLIKPEISEEHLNYEYAPPELVPVKWGEQHFLIPAERLINFAYAVHSRSESQIENYFANSKDFKKTRRGLPNLSKEYEKILKMNPVKALVIAITKDKEGEFYDTGFTLNVGRKDNVIEGMSFFYKDSENFLEIGVEELQENASKAKVLRVENSGSTDKEFVPKIGMRFTSQIPRGYY